jgi:hypothetical protein
MKMTTISLDDKLKVVDKEKTTKSVTNYLIICLAFATIGSAFQAGWNIGIYNTPENVIKQHFNQTYAHRNGESIPNDTLTTLWSITNGLYPGGGTVGALSSGIVADFFGR